MYFYVDNTAVLSLSFHSEEITSFDFSDVLVGSPSSSDFVF